MILPKLAQLLVHRFWFWRLTFLYIWVFDWRRVCSVGTVASLLWYFISFWMNSWSNRCRTVENNKKHQEHDSQRNHPTAHRSMPFSQSPFAQGRFTVGRMNRHHGRLIDWNSNQAVSFHLSLRIGVVDSVIELLHSFLWHVFMALTNNNFSNLKSSAKLNDCCSKKLVEGISLSSSETTASGIRISNPSPQKELRYTYTIINNHPIEPSISQVSWVSFTCAATMAVQLVCLVFCHCDLYFSLIFHYYYFASFIFSTQLPNPKRAPEAPRDSTQTWLVISRMTPSATMGLLIEELRGSIQTPFLSLNIGTKISMPSPRRKQVSLEQKEWIPVSWSFE